MSNCHQNGMLAGFSVIVSLEDLPLPFVTLGASPGR
jgi:hypothetical protein